MSDKLNDKELEQVVGGTYEEIDEIVELFKKHGFQAEAKKLARSGSVLFEVSFRNVLKDLGFTHKLEVYADSDKANWNFSNGKRVSHSDLLEVLDDFLYRKANNIEEW